MHPPPAPRCFLELFKIFKNIFTLWLLESMGVEPAGMEDKLHQNFKSLKVSTPDHFEVGVPSLQDVMSDDLRCNTKRNNCNVLESSWNHPLDPTLDLWKSGLPQNRSLVGTQAGDRCFKEQGNGASETGLISAEKAVLSWTNLVQWLYHFWVNGSKKACGT